MSILLELNCDLPLQVVLSSKQDQEIFDTWQNSLNLGTDWQKDKDGCWVPPQSQRRPNEENNGSKPGKSNKDKKHKPGNGKGDRKKGRGGGSRIHN